MTEKARRSTAADVARNSGVSTATVSYVLNSTPGQSIPEATRVRVEKVARELGYVPNVHARALARGSSDIAVIDLSDIPYGELIARAARALSAALENRGYLPIVDQFGRGAGASHAKLRSLAAVLSPRMIVTVTPLTGPLRKKLESMGVEQFVSLYSDADAVAERVRVAARTQVAYLHSRGHSVLGYCGTDEEDLSDFDQIRRTAFTDEATMRGATVVHVCSTRDIAAIGEALVAARIRYPQLSAVAGYNDEVALSILSAAARVQLAVPGDIAVIGIDDSPFAISAIPALTTVNQIGEQVVSMEDVLDLLDSGVSVADPWLVAPEVVVRESA